MQLAEEVKILAKRKGQNSRDRDTLFVAKGYARIVPI